MEADFRETLSSLFGVLLSWSPPPVLGGPGGDTNGGFEVMVSWTVRLFWPLVLKL